MAKVLKKSALALLGAVIVTWAQPAMAREFADIYTECGLGALIAPRNEAVAAVTNVTWDLGTTAISSNISSPATCAGGKAKTAAFIYDTYDSLETDLASGYGTHLDALMTLVGYESQAWQHLTQALRADFATRVADPTYTRQSRFEQAQALYDLLYQHIERDPARSGSLEQS